MGLSAVLAGWADRHGRELALELRGPLLPSGMDPTWLLSFTGGSSDGQIALFRGPVVDVAAYRWARPHEGMCVGGAFGVADDHFDRMLDDLLAMDCGGPVPNWLKLTPS
ncbi:hypothetical protein [Cryptosporangium arvum]|uniref:Uncharacterized protein n=1 Tax=Cryptosporangium arvum DSM 44712 TaxID=927661 RepID=A0A010ZUE0_9ACTN|nr:hypothetical protein [Cryptosporangium arvum]EXG82284.1 hypothetical protein CryarDRAFT_3449 [Cryptosporangium arvum DSM 44712]